MHVSPAEPLWKKTAIWPDLGPGHHVLPFARLKAVVGDIVLDGLAGMRALQIADLAIDQEVFFLVHLLQLHDDDIGGFVANSAQRIRCFDVGVGRGSAYP